MSRRDEPSFHDFALLCDFEDLESMRRFVKAWAAYDAEHLGRWIWPYDRLLNVVDDRISAMQEFRVEGKPVGDEKRGGAFGN